MSQQPQKTELETDPRFPSGQWTGFWLQRTYAGRQWMSLNLEFSDGAISGAGSDRIGNFDMAGTYDLVTGKCSIVKTYHGAHRVLYDGRNDGDGLWIWGVWTIGTTDHGGFHLWPANEDDPTGRKLQAEKELPREQVHVRIEPVESPAPVEVP